MAERTVKVKLVADVSEYTTGLIKAAAATRQLGADVEKGIDRSVSPAMRRAGEKQGGLLAQGFRTGFVRNSPLIAAAVGAALAAGAPVALAGASVLFSGIGAIASAQSSSVRESWTGMFHEVRDGAVADAAVLIPTYERMADKIGAAFQRLRPELREAFEASAPQIDRFTDGITRAAENAMPGLLRAVERGGPVIDGLSSLMEDVGTGLSDFFDAMSDNSDAAGEALAAIGDTLEVALPLLGELLGTGAELAADVLPGVASGGRLVLNVMQGLGPLLPLVAKGFMAMKVAGSVGTLLGSLAVNGQSAAAAMTGNATAGVKTAGILSKIGNTLPIVGAGFVLLDHIMGESDRQAAAFRGGLDGLYAAIRSGGPAGEKATADLEKIRAGLARLGDRAPDSLRKTFDDAAQGARDYWQSLTPVEQAQSKVSYWTDELARRLDDEGASAADVEAAQRRLAHWTGETERANAALEQAIDGVTATMLEQAQVALAAANSDLAYRMSVDATKDALFAVNEALAQHGIGSNEAQDALLALEQATLRQAGAARQSAFDTSTATSEAGKNAEADAAMLAELLRLQSTMGSSFPAALNTTITRLQGSTNAGMVAAAQFNQLGLNILAVPNSKTVIVSSTTPQQIALLESLGFKVRTLPDGTVEVTALTAVAENAINQAARDRVSTITVRTVAGSNQSVAGSSIRSFAATGGAIENGRVQHFDIGGAVRGMGGPTADRVPAMLSNGEHVWTSAEVNAAGGQAAVAAMRRAVLSGREFSGGGSGGGSSAVDINRLANNIASILASRPTVGSITTQRNETGFELAERLSFTARTGG